MNMQEVSGSVEQNLWEAPVEGQLSVDVVEKPREVVVRSAIAGVRPEDLNIVLTHDTLTIRGQRHHHHKEHASDQVHVQECYWGAFSRSVVLPCHVDQKSVQATLEHGLLTVRMKKMESPTRVEVV